MEELQVQEQQEAVALTLRAKPPFYKPFIDNVGPIFKPFDSSKNVYMMAIIIFGWVSLFLYFWNGASALIPTPTAVFTELINFTTNADFYRDLIASLILTFKAMGLSILISCFFAYLSVTKLFRPIAHILVKARFMSLMGFIFTFTLMFHAGGTVKIALLMLGIIPFFTLSLLSVIDKIPQMEHNLWTTLRFNSWEKLWYMIIKGKADATIEAIRANFAMAWLMITMVESFSMSEGGLGVMLFKYGKYNQLDHIFALQIVILLLGVIFDYTLRQVRYFLFPHVKIAEKK